MRIAIVDDLKTDQTNLASCLEKFCTQAQLLYEVQIFDSGESFLEQGDFSYDLIFLDIYMQQLTGMETAEKIRLHNQDCLLVFTTTSEDFAVKSYRVHAFDYLLKPYTYEQFAETMLSCAKRFAASAHFIQLKSGRLQVKIRCQDIIYADYYNHYVQVHTNQDIIHSLMFFEDFWDLLRPYPQFLYCNRNCLINMDKVTGMNKDGFLMSNGECITTKRSLDKELRQSYSDYLFKKLNGA